MEPYCKTLGYSLQELIVEMINHCGHNKNQIVILCRNELATMILLAAEVDLNFAIFGAVFFVDDAGTPESAST